MAIMRPGFTLLPAPVALTTLAW